MIYSYDIEVEGKTYRVEFCYKKKNINFIDSFPELYGLGLINLLGSTYPFNVGDSINWGKVKGNFTKANVIKAFTSV